MTTSAIKISIIAPVFNEEAVVHEFYERTRVALETLGNSFEIIFIDDGSQDQTLANIKSLRSADERVKAVSFSRNFGHPVAISAGLDHAAGAVVIIMDADLQDPPEVLPKFLEKWREGYKVVYGIRKKRKEGFLKRFCYWAFYRIFRRLASLQDAPLDSGDFSLLDRVVVEYLKALPERNRFMRGLRSWVGFRQCGVEYERAGRFAGSTKYPFKKLVKLAVDGIFSFSQIPLRLATFLGFFIAFAALVAILVLLYLRLTQGVLGIQGFAATIIIVLFLGAIQLISIGILGEYVGRIYEEVKQRPIYIIKEKIGF